MVKFGSGGRTKKDTIPQVALSDVRLEGNLTQTADSDVSHGPPYHYEWAWHRADGSPPSRVQTDRPIGQVGLKAAGRMVLVAVQLRKEVPSAPFSKATN